MPEPCDFISKALPQCSIIRPIALDHVSAMGAVVAFNNDGLFRGQSNRFLNLLAQLARAADAAERDD